MYIFNEMIDIGLGKDGKWTSNSHKKVAENILLCNPRITTASELHRCVEIINNIPQDKIEKVTAIELYHMVMVFP